MRETCHPERAGKAPAAIQSHLGFPVFYAISRSQAIDNNDLDPPISIAPAPREVRLGRFNLEEWVAPLAEKNLIMWLRARSTSNWATIKSNRTKPPRCVTESGNYASPSRS